MLPCQLYGLLKETFLASLVVSRTITGYRAYVCIHSKSSAKIEKQRNLITTINRDEPRNEKTISRPKVTAKVVRLIFDHPVKNYYSANTNKTCNFITTIN